MAESKEMVLTPEQIEKAKAARRAYMREWRKKHREKAEDACLRYWLRQAQKMESENEYR